MNKNDILQALQEKKYRLTKSRKALVGIFCDIYAPLTIEQLHTKLEQSSISVNITTVYREVEFLLHEGYLQEVYFKDAKVRYELSTRPHHHHLVCTSCDAIEDIGICGNLRSIQEDIHAQTGFTITEHALEFFGVCKQCKG